MRVCMQSAPILSKLLRHPFDCWKSLYHFLQGSADVFNASFGVSKVSAPLQSTQELTQRLPRNCTSVARSWHVDELDFAAVEAVESLLVESRAALFAKSNLIQMGNPVKCGLDLIIEALVTPP